MRQYIAAVIAAINKTAELVAPHRVARFAILLLFLAGCGVGYGIGQFQNLVELTGIEPVRSTYTELTQIRAHLSREDVELSDFEVEARHLRALSNKYAARIRFRDQFELRKQRRACLVQSGPT